MPVMPRGVNDDMMAVSSWVWAEKNQIRLIGGRRFTGENRIYQIDFMEDETPIQCSMKGAQRGGFTDGYILKIIHGCIYGKYKLGALFVFPTVDEVTDLSGTKVGSIINENPRIVGKYLSTDRIGLKKIGSAYLYFRSGTQTKLIQSKVKSSSRVKSISVDVALFDEVDDMDQDAVDKARFRLETSAIGNEFYLGNPTIPEYGIHSYYLRSDQKVWMTRCSGCNEWTCLEMEFPNSLQRQKDGTVKRVCVKCGSEVDPNIGEWVAQVRDRSKDFSGYWIGHLSCPSGKEGDEKVILDEWEDPNLKKRNFYNMRLGLPYVSIEERLTKGHIYNCCTIEVMDSRHPGPCAMGIDVQGERKGFHVVIGCKITDYTKKLVKVCRVSKVNDLYDLIGKFNIECAVVDVEPETRLMKDFAENAGIEVFLCKYKESQRKYPDYVTKEHMVTINRTEICDATNNLFQKEDVFLIPRRSEEIEEYASQMINTAKTLDEDQETGEKKYFYRKLGQDDYYHATNYFLLACDRIGVCRQEEDKVKPTDKWDHAFKSSGHKQVGFMGA